MKVLFIVPYLNIARHTLPDALKTFSAPEIPNTGVAALSAFLKKNGHEVHAIDERLGYSYEEIAERAEKLNPDLIGITMTSFRSAKVDELVDFLKKKADVPIVLGGPHVSVVRKDSLKKNKAEFAIKHEGEHTLLELLKELNGKKRFAGIKGLIWRKEGKIIENPDREWIKNLDELPFMDFSIFELDKYYAFQNGIVPLLTSRGCPFQCVFCSARLVMGSRIRLRSAENVLEEIELWHEKGIRKFDINDEIFTANRERTERICDMIIERNLKIEFRLYNGIRVDTVDFPLLKKMRQAGCTAIAFGVETGNPEIMKNIKKGITLEQVKRAVSWSKSLRIKTTANFIVGHPGETLRDALDTLKFATEIPVDTINFNNAVPYPGTELFQWVEKNGEFLISPERYMNNLAGYKIRQPIFETKEFPKEERMKMIKLMTLAVRKKFFQTKLKRPLSDVAFFVSKSDLGYRIIETLRKNKAYLKVFRKSIARMESPR